VIEQFKYINNLGRFETFTGRIETALQPFTLVYSENGRGKTTLCALLRSLSTSDPEPLHARKRVSAKAGPHAVVTVSGLDRAFDGTAWGGPGPTVLVFDDHFTAANVCSGLEVAAGHRQSLHELVVGEEGVRLQRRVEALTQEIADHQRVIREKAREIPPETRGAYALDDFCALTEIPNIHEELREARLSTSVLRDQEKVRSTGEFTPIALPTLPAQEVRDVLSTVLPDLDAEALAAVSAHFEHLGERGERWVADGVRLASGEACPLLRIPRLQEHQEHPQEGTRPRASPRGARRTGLVARVTLRTPAYRHPLFSTGEDPWQSLTSSSACSRSCGLRAS